LSFDFLESAIRREIAMLKPSGLHQLLSIGERVVKRRIDTTDPLRRGTQRSIYRRGRKESEATQAKESKARNLLFRAGDEGQDEL
jgi:hypothetical protein